MKNFVSFLVPLALTLQMTLDVVYAHGRLSWPPSRASCWRHGYRGCRPNHDDNQLNCGGFQLQWEVNGGRCGICGEPYNDATFHHQVAPADRTWRALADGYRSGDVIDVEVIITASHRGWHEFRVCDIDSPRGLTQDCLDRGLLQLTNGSGSRWYGPPRTGSYWIKLRLPDGVRCRRCVLQWKWQTGNRWGCGGGKRCCLGCGPQEQFYGCADIVIG